MGEVLDALQSGSMRSLESIDMKTPFRMMLGVAIVAAMGLPQRQA
jgi:histone acetyltransferase (RNA polymerase elongator complex component)